jgi:hypothetical protein
MDSQIVAQHPSSTNPTEKSGGEAERKVGFEICPSADLSSRFFRGWGQASRSRRDGDLWARRLAEVRALR